jgi:DNA gyrase subunit A
MWAFKSGRAIRFPEYKVRPTGRGAIGVAGIEVNDKNDEVVGMVCVNKDDTSTNILVVSGKGFGKRTAVDEYRITNRGGKGVKTINVTDKTGPLIGMLDVTEKEDLMITCKSGVTIRTSIATIREAGRATQGVKLIRLDEGDEIAAITKLNEHDTDEELEISDTFTPAELPSEIITVSPLEDTDQISEDEDTSTEDSDQPEDETDIQ